MMVLLLITGISFKFKEKKITAQKSNNGTKNVEIMVPLKFE